MALMMMANDLSAADVCDPAREVAFPESVVSVFKGELGSRPTSFQRNCHARIARVAERPFA